MKFFSSISCALTLVLAIGCGGSDTPAPAEPTQPAAEQPTSSTEPTAEEPAVEAPTGGPTCAQEIALECAEGSIDGCLVQTDDGAALTAYHICVPEGETASQPCAQEIARQCDEGFVDACGLSPAAAATHICVAPPASPDTPVESP